MHQLAAEIRQQARRAGFDLVGIASAEPSRYRDYFRQWLDSGQSATMQYLHRRFEQRVDPASYLPGAKSVICVAMNYCVPLAPPPQGSSHGRIARYALGQDYHELFKARLYQLADWIRARVPDAQTRCAVDTAPVMEKELAARAGVGWIGKNTCIINERIGSWLLLGEVLTTLQLPPDDPGIDRCGTCRRCIDACPTQAITAPYQLDARRCISYLTIERREPIPEEFSDKLHGWLFGCDICQEVCPWNSRAPLSSEPAFQPRFSSGTIDLRELLRWPEEEYRDRLRGSAIKRVKLPVLQRNAKLLLDAGARKEQP